MLLTVVAAITVFYFISASFFPRSYEKEINRAASATGLDADLIRAVIWTESKFDENADEFRIFFIYDGDIVVVLFNAFKKKTQKTPDNEIKKAIKLKEEYYATKRNQ